VPSNTAAHTDSGAARRGRSRAGGGARAEGGRRESASRLAGILIFYGSLLLTALSAVPYGSIEPWWAGLFSAGVFALGAVWAVESLLSGGPRLSRGDLLLLLPPLALALFALFQTVPLARDASDAGGVVSPLRAAVSADPFETYNFALRLLALALLGAMLLRFTRGRRRLTAVVLTVVTVGAASALFGLLRQATQTEELGDRKSVV